MIKIAVVGLIVVLLILLGRLLYERLQSPSLTVAWNFPPPGTQGGRYVYIVGFTPGSGTPFSALAVTHVDIVNHVGTSIANPKCSEPHWNVHIPPGTQIVTAEGLPAAGVTARFDASPPDESYTLREMHVKIQFNYAGWFSTWVGNTASTTLLVPVPYTRATPAPQVMDDAQYYSLPQDIQAGVPVWYGPGEQGQPLDMRLKLPDRALYIGEHPPQRAARAVRSLSAIRYTASTE